MKKLTKSISLIEYFHLTNKDIEAPLLSNGLFFDIETTGLSARSSIIFLIGFIKIIKREIVLTQLIAEDYRDEIKLLEIFNKELEDIQYIIHYNGNTFDIPFIKNRCEKHSISNNIDNIQSIDLYQKVKHYKKLLNLSSYKQKSIEKHLNILRNDKLSGAELIDIYNKFIASNKLEKLTMNKGTSLKIDDNSGLVSIKENINKSSSDYMELLLLHNFEDVYYLPRIYAFINNIQNLLENINVKEHIFNDAYVILNLQSKNNLDFQFNIDNEFLSIEAKDNIINIKVMIKNLILKRYFENYKDYYYLPEEDKAIHKSVAQFVDSSYRKKATKETAYLNCEGNFIICLNKNMSSLYKENYKSTNTFITEQDFKKMDNDNLLEYSKYIIEYYLL